MKCPVCRSGDLAWAWTLEQPEFRVGKGRCQNFDCCAEYILTRAADDFPGDDATADAERVQAIKLQELRVYGRVQ